MLSLLSGLLAGGLHTLSGPDHLAAVLPLAAHAPARARAFGTFWGLGHGGGLLLWLAIGLCFRGAAPLSHVSHWAELFVGASLVIIGLWMFKSRTRDLHHDAARTEHAALGMGVLHGTAGAGHLVVALPLLGLSVEGAALYCLGFVASGVISMAAFGFFMGKITRRPQVAHYLRPICAVVSCAVGCAWIANALLA